MHFSTFDASAQAGVAMSRGAAIKILATQAVIALPEEGGDPLDSIKMVVVSIDAERRSVGSISSCWHFDDGFRTIDSGEHKDGVLARVIDVQPFLHYG